MAPEQTRLDDDYTDGIYYDASTGDFCMLQRGEDYVELVHPETGDVYHEIEYDDWGYEQGDFYPVPEKAINDPESYLENWVRQKMAHSEMDVGLMFADSNTQIVRTDDHSYIVENR